MALEAGTRLGHYEVVSSLGAGGMGEVYRARDTKLGREVAIKLLLEEVSQNAERLARFEREAKVLASLNHPNIGSIYGLEEAEGVKALVLELVEGPTLADRIAQGAIPLDEALPIAKQIAEALEAAHEQGVIHRDLKPANVKVKSDGTVKVLDFGLAKAFQPDASDPSLSQSPTLSLTAAATQMGMVIGTAALSCSGFGGHRDWPENRPRRCSNEFEATAIRSRVQEAGSSSGERRGAEFEPSGSRPWYWSGAASSLEEGLRGGRRACVSGRGSLS